MRKLYLILLLFFPLLAGAQQKLLSPKEFLGYELGDRFTRHHRVIEYFQHVAAVMPNVALYEYGETYEHRPLVYAVITSTENFNNIDQIRQNNLKRAGVLEGGTSGEKFPIVWLSYNVHGNEANSIEASMLTLYELANPSNTRSQSWLKNTVVIIDPCINPDGRDRYANFYNQYGNLLPNTNGDAKEHHEPWPGGRANHYLFDLNRDWAWQTQLETQQRMKVYNQWLPHVHVDFHEQGYNNPYYFAPAAEPYHEVITPWQREFQTMIGKNNAKYFDEKGWLYFTKEVFDLFYPSYGDSYPMFSGAIGMTYEQAGGGYAGLSIATETGDPLTLKDRLTHHTTAGLSTVEITSLNASRVIDEFEKYYRENNTNPASPYKTFIIKGDNQPDKLNQIAKWLESHSIKFGHPGAARTTKGFDFQTQSNSNVNITTEDIVISVYQPKSRFITTVFEPQAKLTDSLTYDITAWNLMYAYDLKGFAVNERINPSKNYQPKTAANQSVATKPYAYIFRYQSMEDVKLLASLLDKNVRVRSSERSFSVSNESFNAGSLIVTRRNNEHVRNFDSLVLQTANSLGRRVYTTTTGFVDKGKDFGSSDLNYLKAPKVAMLFGEQTSSLNSGEVWHFFEQQLRYPITQIGTDYFRDVNLSKYDVLIIPEGYYRLFEDAVVEKVSDWVSGGGRLILIANAINSFADKKGFAIKRYTTDDEKTEAEKKEKETRDKQALARFEDAERSALSDYISGAIYKVSLDNSHPLAFGLSTNYFSLKTNELRFGYLGGGWNVGILKDKVKPVMGFAGYHVNKTLDKSLVFGVQEKGKGEVVYLVDNPLFRSFWENGKMIFSNAVFMVGQ